MTDSTKRSPSLTRRTIHTGVKFDLDQVSFVAEDGSTIVREVVRHPGAVVILPLIEIAGVAHIVMIRNFRLSIAESLWELPAGTRGISEDPAVCALRELREETGYAAATLDPFGWYHLSPGMTDEKMFAFVARDLTPVGQGTEPDEFISVHPTPVGRVLDMIRSAEIVDAKTIATVLRWQHSSRPAVEP